MGGQSIIVSFFIAATIGCRADSDSQTCGEGTAEQDNICVSGSDDDASADAESTVVVTDADCDGAADNRD